jgi:hypothetical protein
MISWWRILQKCYRKVVGAKTIKPSRRDTMGTLIIGAGTLLGLFLGTMLVSMLNMARRADDFIDLMNREGKFPAPEDIYWVEESETGLRSGGGKERPTRDAGGCGLRLVH